MNSAVTRVEMLRARYARLERRERGLLALAAAVIVGAILWLALLAPALRVVRQAPMQQERIDHQLTRMHRMQAEADALKLRPRLDPARAAQRLEQSVQTYLGNRAALRQDGASATLTLQGAPASALAEWTAHVTEETGGRIQEAHLRRDASNNWTGTVSVRLGAP